MVYLTYHCSVCDLSSQLIELCPDFFTGQQFLVIQLRCSPSCCILLVVFASFLDAFDFQKLYIMLEAIILHVFPILYFQLCSLCHDSKPHLTYWHFSFILFLPSLSPCIILPVFSSSLNVYVVLNVSPGYQWLVIFE